MNTFRKLTLLAACLITASVTSCVSDSLTEPGNDVVGKEIATLEEQAAAVSATVSDLNALKEAVEGHDAGIDRAVKSLEDHISLLKDASSWEEATLATLAQQKKLAAAVGPILAQTEAAGATKTSLEAVEANAKAWLGKNMEIYWSAALAEAQTDAVLTLLDSRTNTQMLHVEGLASDVEAGLRTDEKPEELKALAKSVAANIESSEELRAELDALVTDIEDTYRTAIQTAASDPASYDSKSVASMNKAAAATLSETAVTLQSLAARVTSCESQLEDIKTRLGALEVQIEDLKKLLDMIQSVTFVSDYSADYAVAEYQLNTDTRTSDGKICTRTATGTITLNYLVRPASAAAALADNTEGLWNNGLKVFYYYAGNITKAIPTMYDFNVTNVEASSDGTGLVTITVANNLKEDFYYEQTGAKLALSIATGKTDITSKFIEIYPKDQSGTVYVEGLSLDKTTVVVDDGQTAQLTATVSPSNVYDGAVTWTTSDNGVVTVSANGKLTAVGEGTATITATTEGVDKWGNTLAATCSVQVLPNIKIVGSTYVEKGSYIELRVESPDFIDPNLVTWTSAYPDFATVSETGTTATVTAVATYFHTTDKCYKPITITCNADGTTLYHDIYVVEVQPKSLVFKNLDDVGTTSLKLNETLDMSVDINPAGVDSEKFKVIYQASGGSNDAIAKVGYETGIVEAQGVGSLTFMAYVIDKTEFSYFYPKDNRVAKYLTVNVEPYYVQTITLPETFPMNPNQTATLTATYTSDVDGKQPTYPDLKWTSSDPTVVSVDESTGEMTALKVGSATITATTSHESAVAGGGTLSASCVVSVSEPVAAINIGDYFYSDGTWSTELDANKTVVGVVFSTVSAVGSDTKLQEDYPECSHGLVVSTAEYTSALGYINTNTMGNGNNTGEWIYDNYGYTMWEYTKPNGYSNTYMLEQYSTEKGLVSSDPDDYYAAMFRSSTGVPDVHYSKVGRPNKASDWYIPSYYEMQLLCQNLQTVNMSLANITEATQIASGYHWISTLYYTGLYQDVAVRAFDTSTQNWHTFAADAYTEYPVRVVLAF